MRILSETQLRNVTPVQAVLLYLREAALEYRSDLVDELHSAIDNQNALHALLIKERLDYNHLECSALADLLVDSEGKDDGWMQNYVAEMMEKNTERDMESDEANDAKPSA